MATKAEKKQKIEESGTSAEKKLATKAENKQKIEGSVTFTYQFSANLQGKKFSIKDRSCLKAKPHKITNDNRTESVIVDKNNVVCNIIFLDEIFCERKLLMFLPKQKNSLDTRHSSI